MTGTASALPGTRNFVASFWSGEGVFVTGNFDKYQGSGGCDSSNSSNEFDSDCGLNHLDFTVANESCRRVIENKKVAVKHRGD